LIAARQGNAGGLTVGTGDGEAFVASDIPAILEHTRNVIFLEDGQIATATSEGASVASSSGSRVIPIPQVIPWDPVAAEKGPYRHFMQKEIYEQARAITDTVRGRADFAEGRVHLKELACTEETALELDRIVIVACGSSAYAALVGKFMLENLARVSVEVDFASEFRYRDPIVNDRTAVLAITQSGETVDTLAALDEARSKGAHVWSIVNVIGSQAMRLSDGYILMRSGPEIGVASTKAFTASLVDLYMLALHLGMLRGELETDELRDRVRLLARLPELVGRVLDQDGIYRTLAGEFYDREHFLYLGRGVNYPIALEGALKEISYIHAEGYPAGEMKHGPIALIDDAMPVVAIATQDEVYDKMISQVEQVKSRGGTVIALATEGDNEIQAKADYVVRVPKVNRYLSPVINVAPLQLFAYHVAVRRGCDVDQPRNLAKSVTVE
jgi:glucosamine--fructose-6-phosphate aminotransferase (isomerizing)